MDGFLYIIGSLAGGGSERQLRYLTTALAQRGHRVDIAMSGLSEDDPHVVATRAAGVHLHAMPGSVVQKLRVLRRLIREHRPRVLHSYTFYMNLLAGMATTFTKTLGVGSVRSAMPTSADWGVIVATLSAVWPARQIYNNWAAAETARARRLLKPRRIVVVENHVDVETFASVPPPGAKPMLLGIGNLTSIKRWDRLLRAAAAARQRGSDFRLVIAGEGPERASLERLAGELGLGRVLSLPGYVGDTRPYLAGCAFVVHTAASEGSSNALLETMAAGRAVLTVNVGDAAKYIRDGVNGFLVEGSDEELLARRIAEMIASPEAWVRMGAAARAGVTERFGTERLAGETLAAYERFLAPGRAGTQETG